MRIFVLILIAIGLSIGIGYAAGWNSGPAQTGALSQPAAAANNSIWRSPASWSYGGGGSGKVKTNVPEENSRPLPQSIAIPSGYSGNSTTNASGPATIPSGYSGNSTTNASGPATIPSGYSSQQGSSPANFYGYWANNGGVPAQYGGSNTGN